MKKQCSKCKTVKLASEFGARKGTKDGLKYHCNACGKAGVNRYHRTIEGVITAIYSGQKYHSKGRGHDNPSYSKQELALWLFDNGFEAIFKGWESSGYRSIKKPSIDRIDDFKSYSLCNIRLVTWGENRSRGHADKKSSTGTQGASQSKPVNQYSLGGDYISTYKSQAIASRSIGVRGSHISNCCRGLRNKAGGYRWSYA